MNGPNNPIGWTDFTWNPVKGLCPVGCDYCYARRIYKRFKYDPTIRLDKKELYAPLKLKEPAKIFAGSTIELFGDSIHPWIEDILSVAFYADQHTFQFLSKVPRVMRDLDFPENCWCGTTIERESATYRLDYLHQVSANIKFVSFEPLHGNFISNGRLNSIVDLNWVIIGAETGNRKEKIVPREQWIEQIIEVANKGDVPIYTKDNLKPYWKGELRQEFPKVIMEG